ncbi:IucA/IucC family protein [Symbioplanes lichenis]|uniref:IucA/IucC family protein n=1 Tax=Symbioplanes lichenis TaxID=1629072 RepID=UPI002739856E|nr:IucA/IucC family protein [Actinoplanes lichenis]
MPAADPVQTRAELAAVRPELIEAYDAALPRARAEILARVLGALDREPLPGASLVRFPAGAAAMFAQVPPGLTVHVDGQAVRDPAELAGRLGWARGLREELANSVANLTLAYANPRPPSDRPLLDPSSPAALADFEQLVTDGHPLHPCCRTRTGLDVAGVLAYAPEHRGTLRLVRLGVPAGRWHGDGPPELLAHPWQADRLRREYPWLDRLGETGPVRPLMSLRTVDAGGEHVKTAVDIQMTSAVRTVSPAAVHNGPRLSALLRSMIARLPAPGPALDALRSGDRGPAAPAGRAARGPASDGGAAGGPASVGDASGGAAFDVLAEFGAGAVLVDGRPDRRLAHLRREAPRVGPGEVVLPLAALAAVDPYDGKPVLWQVAREPYAWWEELTALLVPPLLALLDRGVALEAHGQNTLVVLRGGRPVRVLYRDFGGVRISPARLAAAGVEVPPLAGDLPSDDGDELRTKLAAALFGAVTGQLVAVLARGGADAEKLWGVTGRAVAATGTADARALLTRPLPVKATTAMRLAADPLDDIWAYVPNPLEVAA